MTHAYPASRRSRLLSFLLDICCGKSYDADERERVLALLMAAAIVAPVTLVLLYMKEITYFLIALFQ